VLAANVLLGISQGLAWSTAVVMKIDLAGPARRGLAMGLNEAAGYAAVAASAALTGWVAARHGLRPAPFLIGEAWAILGTLLTLGFVRETRHHAAREPTAHAARARGPGFWDVTLRDRDLSAITQAGLVNNLNDGVAWGLFPALFAANGLGVAATGALAALYPAVWGLAQLGTGALSDRVGRKGMITGGMLVQAVAIAIIAGGNTLPAFVAGQVLLGLGTAMVYPTLLAAIADVVSPARRATAVGTYRLWRDLGYAAGALVAGVLADAAGTRAAVAVVAALTAASGVVAWARLRETLPATHTNPVEPTTG
jgi:MFS family permease